MKSGLGLKSQVTRALRWYESRSKNTSTSSPNLQVTYSEHLTKKYRTSHPIISFRISVICCRPHRLIFNVGRFRDRKAGESHRLSRYSSGLMTHDGCAFTMWTDPIATPNAKMAMNLWYELIWPEGRVLLHYAKVHSFPLELGAIYRASVGLTLASFRGSSLQNFSFFIEFHAQAHFESSQRLMVHHWCLQTVKVYRFVEY